MRIYAPADLDRAFREGAGPHYVYVLRHDDGAEAFGGTGSPFYVGIGKGHRLFDHEKAARVPTTAGAKVAAIRAAWHEGREVVRTIDSFHPLDPWHREAELVDAIGLLKDGTGPLTNEQRPPLSRTIGGVEVRKYADRQRVAGGPRTIPDDFRLAETTLIVGPEAQRGRTSVAGTIYGIVEREPGISGSGVVERMLEMDWSRTKSAYTQSGSVCAVWAADWVHGCCFHKKLRIIQPLNIEEVRP